MIGPLEQFVRNAPGNAHAPGVPKPYELSLGIHGRRRPMLCKQTSASCL